jgi:SHS2 domain-containing protein
LPCEETEFLFFDWLNLILLRFENDRLLLSRFEVQMDETGIRSIGYGEPMDRTKHEPGHEVKAITYHGLRVEREGSGWLAEVIVDI